MLIFFVQKHLPEICFLQLTIDNYFHSHCPWFCLIERLLLIKFTVTKSPPPKPFLENLAFQAIKLTICKIPKFHLISWCGNFVETWKFCVKYSIFKRQPHKMVKHTQTICRLLTTNCLSVFDHSVGLALKGLNKFFRRAN